MDNIGSPVLETLHLDAHGIFIRHHGEERGGWLTPSGATTRLAAHAARAFTEAEVENLKEASAQFSADNPGALIEVRTLWKATP